MIISSLKNVLISMILAVFTGVLLMGVNAAVSATPTETPPGVSVSPIFTNITVLGDSNLGDFSDPANPTGELNVSGNITSGDTISSKFFDFGLEGQALVQQLWGAFIIGKSGADNSKNELRNWGDTWLDGDVVINGHLQADSVGQFVDIFSPFQFAAGFDQLINYTYSCPVNSYIVNCGELSGSPDWMLVSRIDAATNSCSINARNKFAGFNLIQLRLVCYDPYAS